MNSISAAREASRQAFVTDQGRNASDNAIFAVERRLMLWLETEVQLRLMQIDEKLEELSTREFLHDSNLRDFLCQLVKVETCSIPTCSKPGSRLSEEEDVLPETAASPALDTEETARSAFNIGPSSNKPPSKPCFEMSSPPAGGDEISEQWGSTGAIEEPSHVGITWRDTQRSSERTEASGFVVFQQSDVKIIDHSSENASTEVNLTDTIKNAEVDTGLASADIVQRNRSLRKRGGQSLAAERVYNFLTDSESSMAAWWYGMLISPIILLSVVFSLVQTIQDSPVEGPAAAAVELCFDVMFFLEVCLRLATYPNKLLFWTSAYNIIDILAAVPPLICRISIGLVITPTEKDATIGRILLTVVPVFRLLKSLRRFQKFLLLLSAFGLAFEALPVLLFTLGMIALVFSSLIFLAEPRHNIKSWPEALWLTIVTMTTIGYGDKVPVSAGGYVIVSVLVVSSVLYMAMPLGIIGSAFTRIWRDRDRILLVQKTRDLLVQWGYSAHDIPELFSLFAGTGSGGVLNINEFTRMLAHMRLGLSNERIIELFESFDNDASGAIDDEEFVRALFPAQYHEIYGRPANRPVNRRSQAAVTRLASWGSDQTDGGYPGVVPIMSRRSTTKGISPRLSTRSDQVTVADQKDTWL